MPRSTLLLGFLLSAVGLTGFSATALAGTLAGRGAGMGQVNQVSTGIGIVSTSGFGTSQNLNVSVPAGTAGIAPLTTSPNAINVQTNIDAQRTIDASNTINVTDTVNGSNVSYGANGASINWPDANALAVIDGMANFNAGVSANNGPNLTAVTDALETANFLSQQQQNN